MKPIYFYYNKRLITIAVITIKVITLSGLKLYYKIVSYHFPVNIPNLEDFHLKVELFLWSWLVESRRKPCWSRCPTCSQFHHNFMSSFCASNLFLAYGWQQWFWAILLHGTLKVKKLSRCILLEDPWIPVKEVQKGT